MTDRPTALGPVEDVDSLPLLGAWVERMEVGRILDEALGVPHGNWGGISPGLVGVGFLLYGVSERDHRIVSVEEWAEEHLETLRHVLGAEVVAQDFTDDRILHVLGQLGEEQARRWEQMEQELGVHLVQAFSLPRETARTDTTTFVLYHGADGTLARFGHSKERRPDLRQFKVVLSTLDPLGLPLLTEALAGNVADDGVYVRAWEGMSAVLGGPDFVFVADCKFSCLANRGYVARGEGIYYAPMARTGKVPEILREWVLGEGFQAQEIRLSHLAADEESPWWGTERTQLMTWTDPARGVVFTWEERWCLVRNLDRVSEQWEDLGRRLQAAEQDLQALGQAPGEEVAPVQAQVGEILKRHRVGEYLRVEVGAQARYRKVYEGPGRPGPQRPYHRQRYYEIHLRVQREEAQLEEFLKLAGWRLHVTNATLEQLSLAEGVERYQGQWQPEIVFTQMTKRVVGTLGRSRDHIADLHLAVRDDYPIDQQLHQRPALLERGRVQPGSHLGTEGFYPLRYGAEFQMLAGPGLQLPLLDLQRFGPLGKFPAFALKLRQLHHFRQIGFQQALLLPFDLSQGLLDLGLPGLEFLGQPVASMGPFQGLGERLWLGQEGAQVLPDQCVQGGGRSVAGGAALALRGPQGIGVTLADVVGVAGGKGAGGGVQTTRPTTHQPPQQILMAFVVPGRSLLVMGEFLLHPVKGLLAHNRRHGEGNPVFPRPQGLALPRTHRLERRFPVLGRHPLRAVGIGGPGVDRVLQDPAHRGGIPARLPRGRDNLVLGQPFGHRIQGGPVLQIPFEHLLHYGGFKLLHPQPVGVAGPLGIDPITERRADPRQQLPGLQFGQPPPPHPVGDQRAFVFGYRPPDLQQQLIMRVLTHGPLQEFHLAAMPAQFLNEQHLMHILPRQAVGDGDQHQIQIRQGGPVTQPIQTRATEEGAAVSVVPIDLVFRDSPPLLPGMGVQSGQLLFNGLGLSLPVRRDPGVKRYSHLSPPVVGALQGSPWSSAAGVGRLGPSGAGRRSGPPSGAGSSISGSWFSPVKSSELSRKERSRNRRGLRHQLNWS